MFVMWIFVFYYIFIFLFLVFLHLNESKQMREISIDRPVKASKVQTNYALLLSSSKGNYVKPHSDILNSVGLDVDFACKAGVRTEISQTEFLVTIQL